MSVRTVLALALTSGCATLHAALDVQAIEEKAALATRHGQIAATPWPFSNADELETLTRPAAPPVVVTLPIGARTLKAGVVEEQLVFRSRLTLRHMESNHARAYVYRHGPLGERPVLLWVPGLYVSDLALRLLRPLLLDALAQGVDVVFFVPPYHLERTPHGFASGDAVLATTLADHLGAIAQGVADVRDLTRVLRGRGVKILGGFAGSMGANLALLAARFEGGQGGRTFDFFTAMIPLVDWGGLLLERPEFGVVRTRLQEAGVSLEALRRLYSELDPSIGPPVLPAGAISVLAARYDQVTPEAPRLRWQRAWGIERVCVLDQGHATMLLSDQLRPMAARLLSEDLKGLDQPLQGAGTPTGAPRLCAPY